MIGRIRRRLAAGNPWDADLELRPEAGESFEPPGDNAVLGVATQASGRYAPDDPSAPDYYKSLVQTALENGGRLGYHIISIPWLRMILAGLESKHIEPEVIWHGIEAGEIGGKSMPEIPPYGNIFQSSSYAKPEPS